MELAQDKRGELKEMKYLTPTRSALIYEIPLAEVITDFFDELKSRSKVCVYLCMLVRDDCWAYKGSFVPFLFPLVVLSSCTGLCINGVLFDRLPGK